jgi:hypothetical protein
MRGFLTWLAVRRGTLGDLTKVGRVHVRNCPTCKAANTEEDLCQEFRDTMLRAAALPYSRKSIRRLERMEQRIPQHMRRELRNDLEEMRASLRRDEEALRNFARRTNEEA